MATKHARGATILWEVTKRVDQPTPGDWRSTSYALRSDGKLLKRYAMRHTGSYGPQTDSGHWTIARTVPAENQAAMLTRLLEQGYTRIVPR